LTSQLNLNGLLAVSKFLILRKTLIKPVSTPPLRPLFSGSSRRH
jgi:hypothetical protein